MKRIRVIPILLLQDGGLVKSVKFQKHRYVGDPINAVRIFNDKEVDELAILDISASAARRGPAMDQIREIVSEAFMPVAYGGGITRLDEIKELIQLGVEKVTLNLSAVRTPELVEEAARVVGSQSVVVSIDVKKDLFGRYKVYTLNGTHKENLDPVEFAYRMEQAGAGEIMLNSIDRDGTFSGYDQDLIKRVSERISVPLIAAGGAGKVDDFLAAKRSGASAVAAGSLFVFQLPHRAVLISYPSQQELKDKIFNQL